jgi:hypothetical protein
MDIVDLPLEQLIPYSVRTYEIIETDGAPPLWRAVDWQPLELSAVPVGADAAAGFRAREPATAPCRLLRRAADTQHKDPIMTRENEAGAASAPETQPEAPDATEQRV